MANLHQVFGQAVRIRRRQLGLSQEELADRAGIHRTYVSAVELGKVRLGLAAAHRLATGLGTSLSELIKVAEARMGGTQPIAVLGSFSAPC